MSPCGTTRRAAGSKLLLAGEVDGHCDRERDGQRSLSEFTQRLDPGGKRLPLCRRLPVVPVYS